MSYKRNFTIEDSNIGYTGGIYKSTTPQSAAKKVASVLFRLSQNKKNKPEWRKYEKNVSKVIFSIRETTNGSSKKTYSYSGKREKLDKPLAFIKDKQNENEDEDNKYYIEYKIIVEAN